MTRTGLIFVTGRGFQFSQALHELRIPVAITFLTLFSTIIGLPYRGTEGAVWLWLPAGILLGALMMVKRSSWLLLLSGGGLAVCGGGLLYGETFASSLALATGTCLGAWLCAWLLDRLLEKPFHIRKINHTLAFFGLAVLASAFGGLLIAFSGGEGLLENWPGWWLANLVGYLLVVPTLLAFAPGRFNGRWSRLEALFLIGCLLAAGWVLFLGPVRLPVDPVLSLFLIFPLLTWAAVRFDQRFVTLALVFLAVTAVRGAYYGLGQFPGFSQTSIPLNILVQIYILLMLVSALTLSSALAEVRITRAALKKSEALLNETQAVAGVGGWEYDSASQSMSWTRELDRLLETSVAGAAHKLAEYLDWFDAQDRPALEMAFSQALKNGQAFDLELRLAEEGKNAGGPTWVRTRGTPVMEKGQVLKVTGTVMDISELKRIQFSLVHSEEQLRLAMEASQDGMWDWRPEGDRLEFSPAYSQQLGYRPEDMPVHFNDWLSLVHREDRALVERVSSDWMEGRAESGEIELRLRTSDGSWRWFLSRAKVIGRGESGQPLRIIGTHVDIESRKQAENALMRANRRLEQQLVANEALQTLLVEQATRDGLTGLYNRRFMDDALQREVIRANRQGSIFSVLMLDIDHFKYFNDQHGHDAGDQVLVALSSLLRLNIRESDIACRYGGEEFVIIMPGASADDAHRRAEVIRDDFSNIVIGPLRLAATISIGVAEYPQHGVNMDELMRAADTALYSAKNSGRNKVWIF